MKIVDLPKTTTLQDTTTFIVDGFADGATKGIMYEALVNLLKNEIGMEINNLPNISSVSSLAGTETVGIGTPSENKKMSMSNVNHALPDSFVRALGEVHLKNGAGAAVRNCVYRGANLGSAVTTDQWNSIKAGIFKNMFLGDYWVISNVSYRIMGFDTSSVLLKYGKNNAVAHHVTIMPDGCLYSSTNALATNESEAAIAEKGLTGSKLVTTIPDNILSTYVIPAFGEAHIAGAKSGGISAPFDLICDHLTNSDTGWVTEGSTNAYFPNSKDYYSKPVFIPSVCNITGIPSGAFGPRVSAEKEEQFPAMRMNPKLRQSGSVKQYWTRDIFDASSGLIISEYGDPYRQNLYSVNVESGTTPGPGVRPYFYLVCE